MLRIEYRIVSADRDKPSSCYKSGSTFGRSTCLGFHCQRNRFLKSNRLLGSDIFPPSAADCCTCDQHNDAPNAEHECDTLPILSSLLLVLKFLLRLFEPFL